MNSQVTNEADSRLQVVCPSCKASNTVNGQDTWWQCVGCLTYVRNMVCPSTKQIVKVHSPRTESETYTCPHCGGTHRTIAVSMANGQNVSQERTVTNSGTALLVIGVLLGGLVLGVPACISSCVRSHDAELANMRADRNRRLAAEQNDAIQDCVDYNISLRDGGVGLIERAQLVRSAREAGRCQDKPEPDYRK